MLEVLLRTFALTHDLRPCRLRVPRLFEYVRLSVLALVKEVLVDGSIREVLVTFVDLSAVGRRVDRSVQIDDFGAGKLLRLHVLQLVVQGRKRHAFSVSRLDSVALEARARRDAAQRRAVFRH